MASRTNIVFRGHLFPQRQNKRRPLPCPTQQNLRAGNNQTSAAIPMLDLRICPVANAHSQPYPPPPALTRLQHHSSHDKVMRLLAKASSPPPPPRPTAQKVCIFRFYRNSSYRLPVQWYIARPFAHGDACSPIQRSRLKVLALPAHLGVLCFHARLDVAVYHCRKDDDGHG